MKRQQPQKYALRPSFWGYKLYVLCLMSRYASFIIVSGSFKVSLKCGEIRPLSDLMIMCLGTILVTVFSLPKGPLDNVRGSLVFFVRISASWIYYSKW